MTHRHLSAIHLSFRLRDLLECGCPGALSSTESRGALGGPQSQNGGIGALGKPSQEWLLLWSRQAVNGTGKHSRGAENQSVCQQKNSVSRENTSEKSDQVGP